MGGLRKIRDRLEDLPGGKYADPIRAFGGVDLLGDLSGKPQEEAAQKAAQLQNNAMMAAIEEQRAARLEQQQNLAPFRALASPDVMGLWSQMAMQPQDYSYNPATDPLLQNAANVASNKVLNLRAAQGRAGSGGTELAINEALAPIYMQRQGQMFDQAFNARNQRFGEIGNIVGTGQNAAAGLGAVSQNAANQISSLRGQGANALAAGQIASANAQAQGTQNTVAALGALAAMFFSDERMKEDMKLVGKDENGMNVYEFIYKNPIFRGYSAQEVAEKDPDHVAVGPGGMLMVSGKYAPKRVS